MKKRNEKKIKLGKINIHLTDRWLYTFIAIGILALVAIGVYALAPSIDSSKGYHESTQVSVNVGGTEKTLQDAIDDGSLGSGDLGVNLTLSPKEGDKVPSVDSGCNYNYGTLTYCKQGTGFPGSYTYHLCFCRHYGTGGRWTSFDQLW